MLSQKPIYFERVQPRRTDNDMNWVYEEGDGFMSIGVVYWRILVVGHNDNMRRSCWVIGHV
jgi:hypothetical protein